MLKKLELESLQADLAAVTALLAARTEDNDPVGWMQLSERKADLKEELGRLNSMPPDTKATVGLFFGGGPVVGSKGIAAGFAGKILDRYHDLVAKRYVALESGPLGERGRIPTPSTNPQMIVTEVARGSFGFILEEVSDKQALLDTSLKIVVEEISELIHRFSVVDEDDFEMVLNTLDSRLLASFKEFFKILDEAGATLKVATSQKEYVLQWEGVERARARADSMEAITESEEEHTGIIYLLPDSQRFELHGNGFVRKGPVTTECLDTLRGEPVAIPADVVGRTWQVILKVREVFQRNGTRKYSYTLTRLIKAT
ncbi:MAG: hypothetical protein WAT67_12760 [Candidatus Contendobacter sp.]